MKDSLRVGLGGDIDDQILSVCLLVSHASLSSISGDEDALAPDWTLFSGLQT